VNIEKTEIGAEVFGVDYSQNITRIQEGIAGNFEVKDAVDIKLSIIYQQLLQNGAPIADNHPKNLSRHQHFLRRARGRILISGLGLGETLFKLLEQEDVELIRVIEKHQGIIDLVKPAVNDQRVNLIRADIFDYTPGAGDHYDFVYHSIWNTKKAAKAAERNALQEVFDAHCDWQGFVFFPGKGGPRSNAGRKKGVKIGHIKDPAIQRVVRKGVRFTPDEMELITLAANAAGMTESAVMQAGAVNEAKRLLRDVAAVKDPSVRELLSRGK
jgi:hypothetical protein